MRGQHSGGEAALGTTTEPQREMASALVDGEASEFETRRLLEALGEPEVRALVARHYTVRTLLRRDAPELCPPELTASIFAALDAETSLQGAVPASRWRRWAGRQWLPPSVWSRSSASAACLALAPMRLVTAWRQRASAWATSACPLPRLCWRAVAPFPWAWVLSLRLLTVTPIVQPNFACRCSCWITPRMPRSTRRRA
jgi:hypothetical protein